MISIKQSGDFKHTDKFLKKVIKKTYYDNIDKYGRIGVEELSRATPADTGTTAESWDYEIHRSIKGLKIVWTNSNMAGTVPVAILIQYGHATRNGAYVQGIDFINPALRQVFDKLAEDVWKEVTNS